MKCRGLRSLSLCQDGCLFLPGQSWLGFEGHCKLMKDYGRYISSTQYVRMYRRMDIPIRAPRSIPKMCSP